MKIKGYIERKGKLEKGIERALSGRLKYIFIVLKLRLIQIFQRKRNYFVQINFAEKNYLFSTASGNFQYNCYKAIAGGGNSALLCSDFALEMLPRAVIFRSGAKSGGKKIKIC
jgi:hypothetical protein